MRAAVVRIALAFVVMFAAGSAFTVELAATKEQGVGRRARSRPLRTGIQSPGPAIDLQHEIEPISSETGSFRVSRRYGP